MIIDCFDGFKGYNFKTNFKKEIQKDEDIEDNDESTDEIDTDDEEEALSIYDEDVYSCRDPETHELYTITYRDMRGIVDNYSNPISSTLASLYEALLVKTYIDIDLKVIRSARVLLRNRRNRPVDDGYFELMESYDGLARRGQNISFLAEKLEKDLFDIQEKTADYLIIYEDVSSFTKMDVGMLANFCSDMAEVEIEYLLEGYNYSERMKRFSEIIYEYTVKMSIYLASQGVTVENFPYDQIKKYLKCVY